jgi:hypothetical protein
MWPFVILVLFGVLASAWSGQTKDLQTLADTYQARVRQNQLHALAGELERYAQQFPASAYPATLDDLQTTAGFEQVRGWRNNWQSLTLSALPAVNGSEELTAGLQDGVWPFQRLALLSRNPADGQTASAVLNADANNRCSSTSTLNQSFTSNPSWCLDGRKLDALWWQQDTRQRNTALLQAQRLRLNRFMQKLAQYYNKNSRFPDTPQGGTALTAPAIKTLAEMAGVSNATDRATLLTTCTGTRNWGGMPVDCGDMVSLWGSHVYYQYLGSGKVALTVETPVLSITQTTPSIKAEPVIVAVTLEP